MKNKKKKKTEKERKGTKKERKRQRRQKTKSFTESFKKSFCCHRLYLCAPPPLLPSLPPFCLSPPPPPPSLPLFLTHTHTRALARFSFQFPLSVASVHSEKPISAPPPSLSNLLRLPLKQYQCLFCSAQIIPDYVYRNVGRLLSPLVLPLGGQCSDCSSSL